MPNNYEATIVAWLTTRLAVIWTVTAVLAAATVLGTSCMNGAFRRPPPVRPASRVRVDTVRSVVYDTVISRAKDTVRVIEQQVGPLTEQRIARLICGRRQMIYDDDARDHFGFNAYGMVFCPRQLPEDKGK